MVHKLDALNGKKAEPRIQDEQRAEGHRSAEQHQEQAGDSGARPYHAAGGQRVGEHEKRLRQPSEPAEIHIRGEHLKHDAPRPQQDSIQRSRADQARKNVEPAREAFGQRERRQRDREAEQHLGKRIPLHLVEAVVQKIYAEKRRERDEKLSDHRHREGRLVNKLRFQQHGQIFAV